MIVQHPESVGQGPQLFQAFTVHTSPITKVMLSEKHLVSGRSNCLGFPPEICLGNSVYPAGLEVVVVKALFHDDGHVLFIS